MRSSSSLWINPAPLWGPPGKQYLKHVVSSYSCSFSSFSFLFLMKSSSKLKYFTRFQSIFRLSLALTNGFKPKRLDNTFCTGGLKLRDSSVGNRCLCLAASTGRLRPWKSPCGLVHTRARGAWHEYRGADLFRMQNISCSWRCRFPGASSLSKRTESLMVLRF